MKYLKTFNELIKESNIIDDNSNVDMRNIFTNMFRIFKNKDEFSDILDDESLSIATDIYDAFVDARELLELPEEELQVFAANLGVGGEEDIFFAIVTNMYEDKFKRNLKEDMIKNISNLEEYINSNRQVSRNDMTKNNRLIDLSRRYLTELKKINDNL